MSRSFRLTNPRLGDSVVYGRFVIFVADIDYRKDEVHIPQKGRVAVQIPVGFMYMAGGAEKIKPLLSYYAIEKLKEIFSAPNPELEHQLEPSAGEYDELLTIDSSVIDKTNNSLLKGEYTFIDERPKLSPKKVFVSCGQANPNEKQLGKQIKQIIDNVNGFEGYFAENQQSLDGLSKNIFNALRDSVAFIAVMHKRDLLSADKNQYRGSIWIEQEIAIASFMTQTLTMPIKVRGYIQKGINLEGVRSLIQLNPLIFETDEEVINDAKSSIPLLLAQIQPEDNWLIS